MPYQATVYRVMIASPSDVSKERQAAKDIIYEWNALHSLEAGFVLLPVTWETHSTPQMGDHPQNILNDQILKDSDILIGMFWTRIGTPTSAEISGTVEEVKTFNEMGRPVMLYFSDAPAEPSQVNPEQLTKLREFKGGLQDKALYFPYASVDQFRDLLRGHLSHTMGRLRLPPGDKLGQLTVIQTSSRASGLSALRDSYGQFISRLEASWAAEHNAETTFGLDGAKQILRSADARVLDFISSPLLSPFPEAVGKLQSVLTNIRSLQSYRQYLGRESWDAFWKSGAEIMAELRGVGDYLNQLANGGKEGS